MLIKAILVALLATGSQWWFSHLITRTWLYPIWSGFLTGVIMGEPVLGMQAAAYIQLTYLGWITAGGSMPGNLMVAGIYGTALTVLSGADPKLAVSFAVTLSLLGILINQAYMTLNSVWAVSYTHLRIMQFLHEVLREIYDIYSINFTENQDLMDNLALHLQNLRNRCKHGMLIKNPLLSELKQSFVLIYDIAAYIAIRFQEQTGYVLDENEISFIALHIMNGIKSIKTSIVRIALINPYGNSVTHIIQQRLQALTDVEMIGCFSMFDFKTLYTEKPDIIVTMVSTSEQMGVPVFQLDNYLQDEEYEKIERIVKSVRVKKSYENIMIHNYFMEDLFCIPSQLTTKDEVITYLCSLLEEQGYVDADFQEQIYEREAIAPTCFGARYAIPHTTRKTAKKNGIAVALLRKPVIWDGFEVNIVLMFALHKSFDQVPKLYDLILNVFDDPVRFAQVLECDSYTAFMKKIHIT